MVPENNTNDTKLPVVKDRVIIPKNVFQTLIKFCEDSPNKHCEGCLYGFTNTDSIAVVKQAIPFSFSNYVSAEESKDESFLTSYLKKNRLDYLKIGHFVCTDTSEILSKKFVKYLIEFQRKVPNSIILSFDYNLYKQNLFSFRCFRLNSKLLDLAKEIEIKEEDPNIFKAFVRSRNILTEVVILEENDPYSLYFSLTTEDLVIQDIPNAELTNKQRQSEESFTKQLHDLGRSTDKYIEEQKKVIKSLISSQVKAKSDNFQNQNKNETTKTDKIDLSILARNISNLSEQLKAMTTNSGIKNSFLEI